jgi:HEAT repeat protein
MTNATLIAVAFAVCAVSSGAQIPDAPPAPVPPPPTTPPPAPAARLAFPSEMFELPDLPDLPDLSDLADLPDLPEMPDMSELSDLGVQLEALHDMQMDLRTPLGEMDFDSRFDFDGHFDVEMPPVPPFAPMAPITPMAVEPIIMEPMLMAPMAPVAGLDRVSAALERIQGQSPFERQFGGIATDPPKAWAQSDPADSLYRLARETLNRGEYRRAAQLFGDITQRFPNSVYAADARYWRAFALYRIGGTNDLREALRSLQDAGPSYRQASLQADAAELTARIRGALAEQGDRTAAAMVSTTAAKSVDPCDREDLAVRIEALKSLGKTDPESTTPILRRVLARRDDCSASLRRAALYLLGKRKDAEAMNLVMVSARTDSDVKVRADALRFLAAMPGDQAISTIEEIARTPGNEPLQRSAIAALGRSDSPRARQSLRAIVERTDLSESLRASALASIERCECGGAIDNSAYLRSLYPRLETTRLKSSALRAIARNGGKENEQWLLTVVRNQNEPVEVRAAALRYAGASSIPIGDLVRMYDVAGDRPLRVQLIHLYAQRNDPEAANKLLEIAKRGTDPDMRRMAISALSRKKDPRTRQLLLEIIDK